MQPVLSFKAPADSRLTPERLAAALDATVFQALRPGTIGLACLYVFYGLAHWFLLPAPAKAPMTVIAFSSALLLFSLAIPIMRDRWPHPWAHPLAALIACVILGNSLAHIYFTAAPRQTMNLVLLTIGVGCVFLSVRWLTFILLTLFAGWWWTTWLLVRPAMISYFDFELCAATVLAIIVHTLRLRTYTRLEELRCKNEHHNIELEAALQSAEHEITERKRVEADLEKAREELERRVQQRTNELATTNEALRNEIAERTRIEAALRKSEANLLLAQKIGHVGSWDLDLQTGLLNWSIETFRIFGLEPTPAAPSREAFYAAVHPDDRAALRNAFDQALRQRATYAIDHRIVRPDGSERLVCERAEFVFDSAGQAAQLIGTVQDITERKQLEDQLRHSQKMDAIGQLAAGVAHDFNNILTVIQGHTSLLNDLGRHDAEQKELLKEVAQAAERAARLTRQLLLFSRKQILQTRKLDLNEVTRNLTSMLNRILGEDIALQFEHSSPLPAIEADPGMIEQILMNLAVNARDAMPRGGQLRITTTAALVTEAQAESNPEARAGRFVRLTVSDTGSGIDPSLLPRIFEPFFTTKPVGKGTGLGLSTVYGIVKRHNGWIEVSSGLKHGTSFQIYFPASTKGRELAGEQAGPVTVPGGTERILVVEDEPAVRQLTCRLLRRYGYEIFEAESGAAALAVWNEHWQQIDLLLTDLVMPGGLSGRELAQLCKAQKSELKVIYTSGYSTDFESLESSLQEDFHFLPKPYQFSNLARLVRECLDVERRPKT